MGTAEVPIIIDDGRTAMGIFEIEVCGTGTGTMLGPGRSCVVSASGGLGPPAGLFGFSGLLGFDAGLPGLSAVGAAGAGAWNTGGDSIAELGRTGTGVFLVTMTVLVYGTFE
jgi:hypothetical protein